MTRAEAIALATKAHEGQTRDLGNGQTEPYIEHCRRVAERVEAAGGSETAIMAAWLHDVIEDCPAFAGEIRDRDVRSLVDALTDHYTPAWYRTWNRKRRKVADALRIALAACRSPEVALIKRADIADNDATIEAKGGQFAAVWREEKAFLLGLLDKVEGK